MWNSVPMRLIWDGRCRNTVCTVKARSLQITPDFSKSSFNPPQAIGHRKLNWIKRKPKTIHKPSFPTPDFLSLIMGFQNHQPWLLHAEFLRRKRDMGNNFFFLIQKMLFVCWEKGQSKMSQMGANSSVICRFFNMAHSSDYFWVSREHLHVWKLRVKSYVPLLVQVVNSN